MNISIGSMRCYKNLILFFDGRCQYLLLYMSFNCFNPFINRGKQALRLQNIIGNTNRGGQNCGFRCRALENGTRPPLPSARHQVQVRNMIEQVDNIRRQNIYIIVIAFCLLTNKSKGNSQALHSVFNPMPPGPGKKKMNR